MRCGLWLGLLFGLSGSVLCPASFAQENSGQQGAAQQHPEQSAPSPLPAQDSSKDPGQPASPANSSSQSGSPATPPAVPNLPPPRSDAVQVRDLGPAGGESSSKDAAVDLSAPSDDEKKHPQSSAAVANAEAESLSAGGVTELHAWDPHRAAKDVEVGDFYFKRKNYRAAEARYRDALLSKDNDAAATIRLAICLEKLGILDDALAEYQSYLRILPHGPQAREAEKAIARLNAQTLGK